MGEGEGAYVMLYSDVVMEDRHQQLETGRENFIRHSLREHGP